MGLRLCLEACAAEEVIECCCFFAAAELAQRRGRRQQPFYGNSWQQGIQSAVNDSNNSYIQYNNQQFNTGGYGTTPHLQYESHNPPVIEYLQTQVAAVAPPSVATYGSSSSIEINATKEYYGNSLPVAAPVIPVPHVCIESIDIDTAPSAPVMTTPDILALSAVASSAGASYFLPESKMIMTKINTNGYNVYLPTTVFLNPVSSSNMNKNITVLLTHGLGSKNPRKKSHVSDEWVTSILIPGVQKAAASYVAYTSRGHGGSYGWESSGLSDPEQFHWRRLGMDMLAIGRYHNIPSFVTCGTSMGSATALYAAMQDPRAVRAVIMLRPPNAWTRNPHKKLSQAEECRQRNPGKLTCPGTTSASPSQSPSQSA